MRRKTDSFFYLVHSIIPDTPTSEGSRNEIETEKKDGAAHWPANIGIGDGNNNVPETDRSTFLG